MGHPWSFLGPEGRRASPFVGRGCETAAWRALMDRCASRRTGRLFCPSQSD